MKKNEILVQICECNSFDHQVIYWYSDDYKALYVYVHLAPRQFWTRLRYAVRYLFGYKSRFGAWDELIFDSENFDKLYGFLVMKSGRTGPSRYKLNKYDDGIK